MLILSPGSGVDSITRTKLHQALKGSKQFERAEQLDEPLRVLCDRMCLREVQTERKGTVGRKPTPTYLVNPLSRNNPKKPSNEVTA